jgi:AP2 domain/HNH endonuclease
MKLIPLTQGKFAQVDDADYEYLSQWKWRAERNRRTWYATRMDYSDGQPRRIRMHRLIMGKPEGLEIHHKDDDGLNNQRGNLCSITHSQHLCTHRKRRGCSSIFKGVYWDKRAKRWMAHIRYRGVHKHLGSFNSEEDAARAYDKATRKFFGPSARLNFPLLLKRSR